MYFFGLIGLGATIGLFLIDTSTFGLWAYIPLQQILLSLLFPTASAMVSMWVKGNSQGEMLGVLSSVTSSAFAFSPLVSGFLVGVSHFSPIWAGTFSMFLAAILFYFGCIRNKFSLKSLLAK
jgi:MFS family permease